MTLYDISNDYLCALDNVTIDEETGEILGLDAVDAIKDQLNNKLEAVALYIKNTDALAESIKAEEKALSERRKAYEKKVDNLKKYIAGNMLATETLKLETAKCKLSFRKSTSVDVADINILPDEYKKIKTEISADKTALKDALKNGVIIEGVTLVESQNLQIK